MCTVPNLLFGLQLIGGRGVVLPFQLENKLGRIGLMRAAQKPSDELKGGGGGRVRDGGAEMEITKNKNQ
jgi:hypothetical protein